MPIRPMSGFSISRRPRQPGLVVMAAIGMPQWAEAPAGFHGTADAHQANTVQFLQGASQAAGGGGHGGNDNAASGGSVSVFAGGGPDHSIVGAGHASDHNWINSDLIASGGNHAGDGGDGYFYGSMIHASFAVYSPINIAVAGYNSSAHADQTNNV